MNETEKETDEKVTLGIEANMTLFEWDKLIPNETEKETDKQFFVEKRKQDCLCAR